MQFVFDSKKVKRSIGAPFNICGDTKHLRALAEQILEQLKEDSSTYRWVHIKQPEPGYQGLRDQEPLGWLD